MEDSNAAMAKQAQGATTKNEQETKVTYYTLLPGEECLLQLGVISFDDEIETHSVNITEVSKGLGNIFTNISKAIKGIIYSLPIIGSILKPKNNGELDTVETGVFVVTNMRCFVSKRIAIKGAVASCCSGSLAGGSESYEFMAFPRSVLTEYNSFTCEQEKDIVKASCCAKICCGKDTTLISYKTVLTVGLNTNGEESAIAPSRNLVLTLDPQEISNYEQAMGVIATLAKLAQQANKKD